MKRYLHYIRKYFENFGFVNRVVWLTVKYNFYFLTKTNKQLVNLIHTLNIIDGETNITERNLYYLLDVNSKADKILKILPLRKTCLINSLIKNDLFRKLGICSKVELGLKKDFGKISAHAWLNIFCKKELLFYPIKI